MKFTRLAEYQNSDELAEEFLNNGRRIVNEENKIIVSLTPKQSNYLEGVYLGRRMKLAPPQYTAHGYYVYNRRVFSWHLQKGLRNANQIVAVFRYTLEDYQQGNVTQKAENITPKKKFKRLDTQLKLWDDEL